jgi:hypothetical protein
MGPKVKATVDAFRSRLGIDRRSSKEAGSMLFQDFWQAGPIARPRTQVVRLESWDRGIENRSTLPGWVVA